MELRDKETGEVKFVEYIELRGVCPVNFGNYKFNSIAELNEKFEDYKPVEPLIKDEKIRKAVRAWAEANDLLGASYYKSSHYWYLRSFNNREQAIDFWLSYDAEPKMIENKYYTITELCGEEEE